MNDIETIKKRIKKLLALSKSDNENEAAAALEKAQCLMEEYGVCEDAIKYESVSVKSTKRYVNWRTVTANAVSWLYGCFTYRNINSGHIVFTGEELEAYLAGEMYAYLINSIERLTKRNVKKNAGREYRASYKYGIASKLYDRIYELGEKCSWAPDRKSKIERAMIFVEQTLEMNTQDIKIKLCKKAVSKGSAHAGSISLNRQTAGSSPLRIEA